MAAEKGNQYAVGNEGGRETLFKPEYIEQIEALCKLGATDAEMADFFHVTVRTFQRWKLANQELSHAIKIGKEIPDNRVEMSLYQKANGYAYVEQQAIKVKDFKDGHAIERVELVDVEKFMPPDTTAMIFWLKNRKAVNWKDKVEHEVSGNVTLTLGNDDAKI